ncbi:copper transporter [Gordonia sp. FQ]|uniref:copper transporter n=1 Tax=Gordonia sp. FQ TaxID=3446634 RepID=UPI003F86ADA8
MISLRQHAISLIAVFLALAVGLFLGSGYIGDRVNALTGTDRDKLGTLQDENDALSRQANVDGGFIKDVAPRLVNGLLAKRSVLLVTAPNASDADTEAVKGLISDSGASFSGQIALSTTLVKDENAAKLGSIIDQSIPAGTALRVDYTDSGSRLGDLLGALLLVRDGGRPLPDTDRTTALQSLRAGGFLDYAEGTVKPAQLVVVLTGGGLPSDSGAQGQLVGRLAATLASRGAGGVLAGRQGSADGAAPVAVVRADPSLGKSLSTVDDVNEQTGQITVILALDAEAAGRSGAYGSGQGATSITVPAPRG